MGKQGAGQHGQAQAQAQAQRHGAWAPSAPQHELSTSSSLYSDGTEGLIAVAARY